MENDNNVDQLAELQKKVDAHEDALQIIDRHMTAMVGIVSQMDKFLTDMLRAGHFDKTVKKLQEQSEPENKLII